MEGNNSVGNEELNNRVPIYTIQDPTTGTVMNLIELIGRGGFSHCYKTFTSTGLTVAIKMTGRNANIAAAAREAGIQSQLDNQFITKCMHSFQRKTRYYTVLELCASDLKRYVRSNGPIIGENMIRLAKELAIGINYMHEKKIMHRDIKPSNIFLTSDGTIKIGDFGLAQKVEHGLCVLKSLSLAYAAPERIHEMPHGFSVDIFSFGCVVFYMLHGHTLYTGQRNRIVALILHNGPINTSLLAHMPEWKALITQTQAAFYRNRQSSRQILEQIQFIHNQWTVRNKNTQPID